MFTKQHYKAIADILIECDHEESQYGYNFSRLADKLADYFEKDNPLFSRVGWFNYLSK